MIKYRSSFEQWMDWFIRDNKIDISSTLVEEVIDGELCKYTISDYLNRTYQFTELEQEDLRMGLTKQTLIGEPVKDFLRKRCIEMIERDLKKTKHKPTHFWEE